MSVIVAAAPNIDSTTRLIELFSKIAIRRLPSPALQRSSIHIGNLHNSGSLKKERRPNQERRKVDITKIKYSFLRKLIHLSTINV